MAKDTMSSESPHYFDRAYLRREVFTQNANGDDAILGKTEVAQWLGIDTNDTMLEDLFANGGYESATLFVRAVEELVDVRGSGIDIGDNLLSLDELQTVFGQAINPKTNKGTAKTKENRKK